MSDEEWNFKAKDDLIYIQNKTKTKTLQANRWKNIDRDGNVDLEDFEEDKAEQLWKKGEPNAEGFFTLQNYKKPKVLTPTSSSGLKIQGNITLRWIPIIPSWLIVEFIPCFLLHVDRLDLIEKFIAEKTGKNYDSAVKIRQNINELKNPRGANTEGMWIFSFPENHLFVCHLVKIAIGSKFVGL